MAFSQRTDIEKPVGQVVQLDAKTAVVDGDEATYASLEAAVNTLVGFLGQREKLQLRAARVVQHIRDQELFKQVPGCETFEAYLPILKVETAQVGWKAERTIQQYMSFADVYLDVIGIPERIAMAATSHLNTLYSLADLDRKQPVLLPALKAGHKERRRPSLKDETEKHGKLKGEQFEDLAFLLSWLVTADWTDDQLDNGVSNELLVPLMLETDNAAMERNTAEGRNDWAGRTVAAQTFQTLMGYGLGLPVGGWTVADTEAVVKKIKGKEAKEKAVQHWYVEKMDTEFAWVERIDWELGGEVKHTEPWRGKQLGRELFEAMSAGDKVTDLSEGEEEAETDGYTSEADD